MKLLLALVALCALCVGTVANAADPTMQTGFNLVAGAGLAFVGNGLGTNLVLDAQGNYRLNANWGVGVYFDYDSLGSVLAPGTNTSYGNSYIHLLARGDYYFGGDYAGLRAGIDLGPSFYSTNLPGGSNSTNFTYGAHAGYDFVINSSLSFGPEASLFFSSQTNGPTIFNVLANLKLYF